MVRSTHFLSDFFIFINIELGLIAINGYHSAMVISNDVEEYIFAGGNIEHLN